MLKFLVYWTNADIDRKANAITRDVERQSITNRTVLKPYAVYSKMAIGVLSAAASLVGNRMYYQRLLSARNFRDTSEGDSDKPTSGAAKIISPAVGNHKRVLKAVFSS